MWGRRPAAWQDILGAGKVTAPSVFYPALALAPERAEVGKAEPLEVERALEVGGAVDGSQRALERRWASSCPLWSSGLISKIESRP